MVKKVEAFIEKYFDIYFEKENEDETIRVYEKELKVNEKKGINYWGYQIRIEGEKEHIFVKNFIIPLDGKYLIKEGHDIENSKDIGIALTEEEANKRAYGHIMSHPLGKLEKMMETAGIEKIIHNKNPVYLSPEVASVN